MIGAEPDESAIGQACKKKIKPKVAEGESSGDDDGRVLLNLNSSTVCCIHTLGGKYIREDHLKERHPT